MAQKRTRPSRITFRAVLLFLGVCLALDILLFAVFHLGFDSCYAVLCFFS